MIGVSIVENNNSLVILIDKSHFDKRKIEIAKNIFSFDEIASSDIPFVCDEEQKEIEELLKNPDCHKYESKSNCIV